MPGADRFEAFVREFQDMVFATAVRLLGNPSEAEDVAQTVFMKAYERFGDAGPGPAAAGWLKTVATNACLNHLSRYRARWRLFSEMAGPEGRAGRSRRPSPRDAISGRGHRAGRGASPGSSARSIGCRTTSACRSCSFTSSSRAIRRLRARSGSPWAR